MFFIENNLVLHEHAKQKRPGVLNFTDLRQIVSDLKSGVIDKRSMKVDLLMISPPCENETTMRIYNRKGLAASRDLFTHYSPELAKQIDADNVMMEITPNENMSAHRKVQKKFEAMGKHCTVVDVRVDGPLVLFR